MILKIIQIILIVYAIVVGAIIVRDYKKNKEEGVSKKETILHYIIGAVVNFFDALGIGSFATTTRPTACSV